MSLRSRLLAFLALSLFVLLPLACVEISDTVVAVVQAKQSVEERLVSPGSADFEAAEAVARTADGKYHIVYVAVDSQNKLGALLRSHWLVLVGVSMPERTGQTLHVQELAAEAKRFEVVELAKEVGESWAFPWDAEAGSPVSAGM